MTQMPNALNIELVLIYAVAIVVRTVSFMCHICIPGILTLISGHFLTMISGQYA